VLVLYSNTSRYTDTSVISPHIIALLFYLCLSQKFKIGQLPSRNHKRQRSLSFGFRQDFAGNRFWDRRDRTDELFEDFYVRVSAVLATATWLAGWLAGWLSHSGIVSKRLNLSENFFHRPSESPITLFFEAPAPIQNSTGNLFSGGVKYTGGVEIGDFRSIFD